jgi:hypothetical protein
MSARNTALAIITSASALLSLAVIIGQNVTVGVQDSPPIRTLHSQNSPHVSQPPQALSFAKSKDDSRFHDAAAEVQEMPLSTREMPNPPEGQEWPFFVAIFNPELNLLGSAQLRHSWSELSKLEKLALAEAARRFSARVDSAAADELPQTWARANQQAQNYLLSSLGYEAYHRLSSRSQAAAE